MTPEKTSSKEIERDVEETRSEIGETLDEMEHRLSPGQLLDQTLNYFGGPRRVGLGVGELIRENPLPITLIGIGIAWIAVLSSRSRRFEHLNSEMEHQTAKDTTRGPPQPMGERGAHAADTVGKRP